MLPLNIRRHNLGRLPLGEQIITPASPRFFQEQADLITGVLPLGAQVVRTTGFSEMPDSSWNPSKYPCFSAHFF